MQLLRRPDQAVLMRAVDGDEIPEAHLGAAAGPDRHPRRSAAGGLPEAER